MNDNAAAAATPGREPGRRRPGRWAWLREVLLIVAAALVISFVIKTFFFRAFYIPSGSMEPTLEINDRIFVNLMVPGPFELTRGDVVVFQDELGWLGPAPVVDQNPLQDALVFVGLAPDLASQHLVKRVIGLPGDTVSCCGTEGRVEVNGTPVDEPYVSDGAAPSDLPFAVTVPEGKIWVMGDHRDASADSRYHHDRGAGFIDIDDVEGTAVAIAWPLDRVQPLSTEEDVFARVGPPSGAGAGREGGDR
ncbi:hypothetical protein GCM10022377_02900 [Zhihengliuella alba]|uniref:Signal peptidase I n=1 Tax=Zhihengliuella alba TaxID=547018 RepID=A0ABP7CNL5_9MICC